MSQSGRKDNQRTEPAEPIITPAASPRSEQLIPVIPPGNRFASTSRNVGTATFSSMAKQAESLVNGDNSIMFNSYNNNAVFKSARMDVNDCVSIDVLNKSINNVSVIAFDNNTMIQGFSDGYTINNQGATVPLYDSSIALSTAFGYEYAQTTDNLRKDLNIEIERRKYDHSVLLSSFQQTSDACEHAVRMIHYISYDTDNHTVSVVIPFEDEQSANLSYVDDMPSETLTYDTINPDPAGGILEYEPRASDEKTIVTINRDGTSIDGSVNVSANISAPVIAGDSMLATNAYTQSLTLPAFIADVPGATYKHPYRGQLIEIPDTKPETEDDEGYYFYRIIGGVHGDIVPNPNRGLGEKYQVPEGYHFDVENPQIRKDDFINRTYDGKCYIGVTHNSALAGCSIQLPRTESEEPTPEAQMLMDLLGYSPSDSDSTRYDNPNYRLIGYIDIDEICFNPESVDIMLYKQYKYIYIDSDAKLNDIYYTPEHTIISVADTMEMPIENLIPSIRAVLEYVPEQIASQFSDYLKIIEDLIKQYVAAALETISFDFDVKQYAIEYNAALTDYVINSTGGLDKEPAFNMPVNPRPGEIPDFDVPAVPNDWAMWINIRKWIIQGIIDSLKRKNGQTYWNDCPNYDILNEYLSFAAALGKISAFDESWSWELFKGDILTWFVGGSSTLSGNSVRFQVHSDKFKDEDKIGGYFCSGAAGFHTNNWLYVGNSTNIPNCNKVNGVKYNLLCTGDAHFGGYTNVSGTFRFLQNSVLQFQKEKIEYAYDGREKFTKTTTFDDLMNRIDNLEAENAGLKDRVKSLEDDVAYLKQLVKHFTL